MTWTHEADILLIELVARGAGRRDMADAVRQITGRASVRDVALRIAVLARTETMMQAALAVRAEGRAG